MRVLQIVLFVLSVAALLGAGASTGSQLGEDLWRTGMALLLVDVVVMRLWPGRSPRATG